LIDIDGIDLPSQKGSPMSLWKEFRKVLQDEGGATAIEYGIIAALISVVAISAIQLVGTNLSSTFNVVATNM
jgi:pilus assembly protein Flp/PilA